MSAQRGKKNKTNVDEAVDSQDSTGDNSLPTKLDRRRRIEDINEERRLRKELSEF